MKLFLLLPILLIALSSNAQVTDHPLSDDNTAKPYQDNSSASDNSIYASGGIDELPEFPGGNDALFRFIKSRLKNPAKEYKAKIIASFVVEKDGSLTAVKLLRSVPKETGPEIVEILKGSPKWKPAKQNKKIVRCLYTLPVTLSPGPTSGVGQTQDKK